MSKKILIDGAFKEETRVALIDNDILEDYDREDFNFKQLKGNIYLAKITRIEPSLQAAFIDYGGDRHGFLPFSDIHPDYYNIPQEDIKRIKAVKFFQNEDNVEEFNQENVNNNFDGVCENKEINHCNSGYDHSCEHNCDYNCNSDYDHGYNDNGHNQNTENINANINKNNIINTTNIDNSTNNNTINNDSSTNDNDVNNRIKEYKVEEKKDEDNKKNDYNDIGALEENTDKNKRKRKISKAKNSNANLHLNINDDKDTSINLKDAKITNNDILENTNTLDININKYAEIYENQNSEEYNKQKSNLSNNTNNFGTNDNGINYCSNNTNSDLDNKNEIIIDSSNNNITSAKNKNISSNNEHDYNNGVSNNNVIDDNDSNVDLIPNYSVDEEADSVRSDDYTKYKIEDVLKEGQYVLVQVLKEERGNKGVAMTTYISIAGKYCVLMVNSPERGGVSKKVTNLNDRKILKSILRSLNVPHDKSIILRTAGVGKKPEEILKDYLYLIRLWKAIKDATLESKAPAFIHAEDDIIKKTIRDLYTDDIDEVLVEGTEVFKSVKSSVKIISNNQDVNVKLYTDKVPLFQRYNIEGQLLDLYNNKVNLPSGGSIVIDQTEALVAIDVNSGKATKEKTVEEMAVATNIEAAHEIARQLKLRDLAGLVVIDYIDMFELKNRRIVEKAMRDAMSNDRARIQIARLSIFGLMEVSRQRLGASFMERSSEVCPRCKGRGKIKSKEIVALSILRSIKYATIDKQINVITVETTPDLSDYLLNFKRREISQIENDYNVYIFIESNDEIEDNNYNIKKRKGLTPEEKKELEPQQKIGKVNLDFDDDELHSISNDDIKKYKFNEEIYGATNDKSASNQQPKRINKKQYNKYNRIGKIDNNSNNKNGTFGRLIGWFIGKKK